ncbi:hypothetical protein D9619_009724 [Psilocybe cf. subviscida]|uniref:BAH domain-containing protein n=1 Tax=Psilocybe cf. subviscida TaxID=2480587 RepID=A0A8H5F6E2_9AGAR|nr:hypothetical protein D9619_009724 [Psilocybe cf. subviscida]
MGRSARQNGNKRSSVSGSGSLGEAFRNFQSFRITDKEGVNHSFNLGNYVTILPHGHRPGTPIEEWQYWVGKITAIHAPHDSTDAESDDVRVEVLWYYNAKDASQTIKSFKASAVSSFERILSETKDFVDVQAFNATVPVIAFHEDDHLAPYIPWDSFFCRYTFEKQMRAIQPKPGTAVCNCHQPYNPNDSSLSSLMHFCPTSGCRRAYHQRCLLKTPTPGDLPPALLLATSPFDDKGLDSDLGGPLRKRRRSGRLSSQTAIVSEEERLRSLTKALADLPEDLVEVAQQPMVRGAAFQEGGVSGNIGFVTRAREIVYDFLESGNVPESWESAVFEPLKPGVQKGAIRNAIVRIGGLKSGLPRFACPTCHSAI